MWEWAVLCKWRAKNDTEMWMDSIFSVVRTKLHRNWWVSFPRRKQEYFDLLHLNVQTKWKCVLSVCVCVSVHSKYYPIAIFRKLIHILQLSVYDKQMTKKHHIQTRLPTKCLDNFSTKNSNSIAVCKYLFRAVFQLPTLHRTFIALGRLIK